jgi:hypothetical protein
MSQLKLNNTKWLDQLQGLIATKESRPPGNGWNTHAEIEKIYGFGKCKTARVLTELKQKGKLEMFFGSVINAKKIKVKAVWYRIKSSP